jgi:polyisoprenoid-binding protein YceI
MLTLKGVSKNITIPFTASLQNGVLMLVGEFTLDRLDYKVGGKSIVMGNEVKVKLLVKVKQ